MSAGGGAVHTCTVGPNTTNSKTIAPSIYCEDSETVHANERNLSRIQLCKKLRTRLDYILGKIIPPQTVRSS
jgi:hypothetical protein